MKPVKPRNPVPYNSSNESYLYVTGDKFIGLDLDSTRDNMPPGYFRVLNNVDVYKNYMRTRRGWKVSNVAYNFDGTVTGGVVWDIGDDDIAVFSMKDENGDGKTRFYWKNLTTLGEFQTVRILGSGTFEQLALDIEEPPTFFVLNNRIYVFTLAGNYIIEYQVDTVTENLFTSREMGMTPPSWESYSQSSGGMVGEYAFGIELVYQVDGVDNLASSPNRMIYGTTTILRATFTNQNINLLVKSSTLPSGGGGDDFWTHVRVYQSRRLDRDTSNPANPIGPFGTEDELYPVALITRSALEGASYHITIDVNDNEIDTSEVWEIDRIELSPLPAAYTGIFHQARIYVAGCPDVDPTESILYYSNFAGTKYSEQSTPLQNVPVQSGDGKKIRKLLSLNENLVIFKETSTFIAQNGNVDLPPVVIDKSIGLSSHKLANYIPKLGLVGITSDQFDLKIFTDGLKWTNVYNKLEISRQVRRKTREYAQRPNQVSFIYINGKLIVSSGGIDSTSEMLVLAVEQGKGWSTYTYPVATCQFVFTYDNDSRAGIITGGNQVQMEIELFDDYEDNPGTSSFPVQIEIETWMFQNNNGQDLLDYRILMISGALEDTPLTATAYVNQIPWNGISDTEFKPNPTELLNEQKDGIYQLYLGKNNPIFPTMFFAIETAGDVTISFIKWIGLIHKEMSLNYVNRVTTPFAPVIIAEPEDETI